MIHIVFVQVSLKRGIEIVVADGSGTTVDVGSI